jgi:hypothetical protein
MSKVVKEVKEVVRSGVRAAKKVERKIEKQIDGVVGNGGSKPKSKMGFKGKPYRLDAKKFSKIKTQNTVKRVGFYNSNGAKPALVLPRKQFVFDVPATTTWTLMTPQQLLMTNTSLFSTVVGLLPYFESYLLRRLKFRFKPLIGSISTGALGEFQWCIMYDPEDSIASESALLNYCGESDRRADKEQTLEFRPSESVFRRLWIAHQGIADLESHGTLYMATNGNPSTVTTLGKVFVDFEIHLFTPRLPDPASIFPRYNCVYRYASPLNFGANAYATASQTWSQYGLAGMNFCYTYWTTGGNLCIVFQDSGNFVVTVQTWSVNATGSGSYLYLQDVEATLGAGVSVSDIDTGFPNVNGLPGAPVPISSIAGTVTSSYQTGYIIADTTIVNCQVQNYDSSKPPSDYTIQCNVANNGTDQIGFYCLITVVNAGTELGVVGSSPLVPGTVDLKKKSQPLSRRLEDMERRLNSMLSSTGSMTSSSSSSSSTLSARCTTSQVVPRPRVRIAYTDIEDTAPGCPLDKTRH